MKRRHQKSPGRDHRLPVMGLVGRRIDPANISSRATTCGWIHDFHLLSSLSPFISWPLPSSWFFSPEFFFTIIFFRILGSVWRSCPRPHCWIRLRDLWELRLRHWTVRPWCDFIDQNSISLLRLTRDHGTSQFYKGDSRVRLVGRPTIWPPVVDHQSTFVIWFLKLFHFFGLKIVVVHQITASQSENIDSG